ncbi:exocyst complex protein [Fomitiporia mediterranea MF3/22]|uniref:exocyst complex protein n=1 Tax=Fomitiporia mediterranea (strain MF3/22) TaxID=694068 RepID=UPI0004408168|nr:exocyst complex protein [Fomitiporia mediterranea MF3/22]EJD01579.1 exocyst complex protein [Fomitiporia mediterranea MF3/22]
MSAVPSFDELDPSVQEQLNLKTFQGKFEVKDFIGSVSERLITNSKSSSGPFNPVPFIRTFEATVDKLIALRKDVQAKSEQMEKGVKVAEREYSRKMSDLNKGFEAVGQSFSGMENKMSEVGRTAIRIGEQLEAVHIQRQRAQVAHDLINYYIQFSRGDTSALDVLRKERGKEGRRELATVLRRLSVVAREVDLPNAEQTREAIDKYCEKFEKDMLNLFDRCYRKEDPKMMHHCAQTLQDFNGGASCIQIYVNQHDFFINRVRQVNDFNTDSELWKTLNDPDSTPPRSEKGLQELFKEIRATVGEEAQIVQVVFPNPPLVMQVFLQRVFAQSIQEYMEQLLNKGTSLSTLAFLRVLHLVHTQVSGLVEDLKEYELTTSTPRSPSEAAELRRSVIGLTPSTSSTNLVTVSITSMLETAMEELFIPYTEGNRYLERESKSLGELYMAYLNRFTRYHEKVNKGKGSVFDRMVNQLSAAAATTANSSAASGASASAQAAAAIMKFSGFSATAPKPVPAKEPEKPVEDLVKEEDGLLSLDAAEQMLKWHAESIGRCVILSPSNEVPKHAFALSRVLAETIGVNYVEVAFETAYSKLETADPKAEPSLQSLSVLRLVDLICHLWQKYVSTALLPLASSSVTVRREMVIFNSQTVSRIEGAANALMNRLTDSIVAWLSATLAKQKKNEFKPRSDELSFVNTEPCDGCCMTLAKVRDAARQNLSGKNLEVFLTEVGITFNTLLLDHLRKFSVNANGGLILAKDLKSYQDLISTFNCPALPERFEFICQLGKIFLIEPEILKSYITESALSRIDLHLLRPYLAQRSDWQTFEKGFDGQSTGGVEGVSFVNAQMNGGAAETKGFRDRLGMSRLSTMMRELEGLRIGDTVSSNLSGGFSFARGLGGYTAA